MAFVQHKIEVSGDNKVVLMKDMPYGSIGVMLQKNRQIVVMRPSQFSRTREGDEFVLDLENGDTMFGLKSWGDYPIRLCNEDEKVVITVRNKHRNLPDGSRHG